MNKLNNLSGHARQDLPRLWPVLSTTLYPETELKISGAVAELEQIDGRLTEDEEGRALLSAVTELHKMIKKHYLNVANIIAQRLTAYPYGAVKFPSDYFSSECEKHELSSAEIKTTWNRVRAIARRRLTKVNSSSEEKLAYAKLNSLEQDVLYVLFVEHQYICPLILRPTE